MRPSMNGRRRIVAAASVLMAAGAVASGCAVAQQPWPNLNDAEANLRAALEALNRAPDRFGGHKGEAMRLIREALAEIEQAKRSYR